MMILALLKGKQMKELIEKDALCQCVKKYCEDCGPDEWCGNCQMPEVMNMIHEFPTAESLETRKLGECFSCGIKAGMEEAAETHKKMEMLIEALKTGNITVNNVPISDELIRREDALDILDQFEDSVENGERGFYEIARCMMQNLDAEDLEKPRMKMISREVKDTLVKRIMPMCTWNGMPKEAVNRLMEITRYVINLE